MTNVTAKRTIKLWLFGSREAKTLETTATTFGELKQEMGKFFSQETLDYTNSRFIEGVAKVSFESDNAQLPTSIVTKTGASTSELNILILPKKTVKNGAESEIEKVLANFLLDALCTYKKKLEDSKKELIEDDAQEEELNTTNPDSEESLGLDNEEYELEDSLDQEEQNIPKEPTTEIISTAKVDVEMIRRGMVSIAKGLELIAGSGINKEESANFNIDEFTI